jgi:hypothetical protein
LVNIELSEGAVTATRLRNVDSPALGVFRELVTWTTGKYSFQSAEKVEQSRPAMPTSLLLLEAMRLNDEAKR